MPEAGLSQVQGEGLVPHPNHPHFYEGLEGRKDHHDTRGKKDSSPKTR